MIDYRDKTTRFSAQCRHEADLMSQIPVVVVRWNLEMLLSHEARITRIETETRTHPSDEEQKKKKNKIKSKERNMNRKRFVLDMNTHGYIESSKSSRAILHRIKHGKQ